MRDAETKALILFVAFALLVMGALWGSGFTILLSIFAFISLAFVGEK